MNNFCTILLFILSSAIELVEDEFYMEISKQNIPQQYFELIQEIDIPFHQIVSIKYWEYNQTANIGVFVHMEDNSYSLFLSSSGIYLINNQMRFTNFSNIMRFQVENCTDFVMIPSIQMIQVICFNEQLIIYQQSYTNITSSITLIENYTEYSSSSFNIEHFWRTLYIIFKQDWLVLYFFNNNYKQSRLIDIQKIIGVNVKTEFNYVFVNGVIYFSIGNTIYKIHKNLISIVLEYSQYQLISFDLYNQQIYALLSDSQYYYYYNNEKMIYYIDDHSKQYHNQKLQITQLNNNEEYLIVGNNSIQYKNQIIKTKSLKIFRITDMNSFIQLSNSRITLYSKTDEINLINVNQTGCFIINNMFLETDEICSCFHLHNNTKKAKIHKQEVQIFQIGSGQVILDITYSKYILKLNDNENKLIQQLQKQQRNLSFVCLDQLGMIDVKYISQQFSENCYLIQNNNNVFSVNCNDLQVFQIDYSNIHLNSENVFIEYGFLRYLHSEYQYDQNCNLTLIKNDIVQELRNDQNPCKQLELFPNVQCQCSPWDGNFVCIQQNEISIIKKNQYRNRFQIVLNISEQIVKLFVLDNQILLFIQNSKDQVKIREYYISQQMHIYYIKQLPLYLYTINSTNDFIFQKSILSIQAYFEDRPVILVYDISLTLLNCLIEIIEDEAISFFSLQGKIAYLDKNHQIKQIGQAFYIIDYQVNHLNSISISTEVSISIIKSQIQSSQLRVVFQNYIVNLTLLGEQYNQLSLLCNNSCLSLPQLQYQGYLQTISTPNKNLVVHHPIQLIRKFSVEQRILSLIVLDHSKIIINSKTQISLFNELGQMQDVFLNERKIIYSPMHPLKLIQIQGHQYLLLVITNNIKLITMQIFKIDDKIHLIQQLILSYMLDSVILYHTYQNTIILGFREQFIIYQIQDFNDIIQQYFYWAISMDNFIIQGHILASSCFDSKYSVFWYQSFNIQTQQTNDLINIPLAELKIGQYTNYKLISLNQVEFQMEQQILIVEFSNESITHISRFRAQRQSIFTETFKLNQSIILSTQININNRNTKYYHFLYSLKEPIASNETIIYPFHQMQLNYQNIIDIILFQNYIYIIGFKNITHNGIYIFHLPQYQYQICNVSQEKKIILKLIGMENSIDLELTIIHYNKLYQLLVIVGFAIILLNVKGVHKKIQEI